MEGTIRSSANYIPLSPISFLERSAIVYRVRISLVYGDNVKFTWRDTLERCIRLASALTHLGISRGDVEARILRYDNHTTNGIPFRLITLQEQHQVQKVLCMVIEVPISILLLLLFLMKWLLCPSTLRTVPMFHCNGCCLTWAVAAQGGTNICLRNVTGEGVFDSIALHHVTHMAGAPTVLNMIINAANGVKKPLPGKVMVMTGAAPPPPQVLFKMEELGFIVTHSYCLTETYGPGTVCTWKPEWNTLPAKIKSRQGLHHLGMEKIDIKDPITMKSVPPDAKTMGEVMFRGNTVMNGYMKDLKATEDAFKGGWFRSGDLGVKHADGYIELKDRSMDIIIISGGENISTIEVEAVLFSHPAVLEAAIVGRPDDQWGESPCAFVKLKDGSNVTGDEIISYCRSRLPHYMAPRTVVFEDLL